MVLGVLKRKKPDPYLVQTVQTDRFELASCTWLQTFELTVPLADDPEALNALMYDRTSYSRFQWAIRLSIPNGHSVFVHSITPKDSQDAIGFHVIGLSRDGTATLTIALTDKAWWGRGVFEEVRIGLMNHFSRSPKVVRFSGRVLSRNFSSVYNYKKLGFRFIGYDQKVWRSPLTGELLDSMYFEFMAEDWRAKHQLELL